MNNLLQAARSRELSYALGLGLLLGVVYFDYVIKLTPCILCWLQRLLLLLSIIWFYVEKNAINPKNIVVFNLCTVLGGFSVAIKQSFLQATKSTEQCLPSLSFLAPTNCASVDWQLGGLSLANFAGMLFGGLAVYLGVKLYVLNKSQSINLEK